MLVSWQASFFIYDSFVLILARCIALALWLGSYGKVYLPFWMTRGGGFFFRTIYFHKPLLAI